MAILISNHFLTANFTSALCPLWHSLISIQLSAVIKTLLIVTLVFKPFNWFAILIGRLDLPRSAWPAPIGWSEDGVTTMAAIPRANVTHDAKAETIWKLYNQLTACIDIHDQSCVSKLRTSVHWG